MKKFLTKLQRLEVPPIVSAKAIGICISAGTPIFVSIPAKPGLNFPDP